MHKKQISRRNFLTITATSITLVLTPNILFAKKTEKVSWKGIALGAESNMTLFHENSLYAKDTLNICIKEIKRLENIFSLFIPNSSICELNKKGFLRNPPKELLEVLKFAQDISKKTNGAFDITVQPLWEAHAKYFNNEKKLKKAIKKANKLVSYKNIIIKEDEILFKIATPYLKNIPYIKLNNQAMASSGVYGTKFNQKYHHLFDVNSGTSAHYVKSVTIKANSAILADALATAVCVMPKNRSKKLKKLYPEIEIYTS